MPSYSATVHRGVRIWSISGFRVYRRHPEVSPLWCQFWCQFVLGFRVLSCSLMLFPCGQPLFGTRKDYDLTYDSDSDITDSDDERVFRSE
jgi:hypothetical protein